MQHGAGDAREFYIIDLAIGFAGTGELLATRVELTP
jgi:hypothetical protein